MKIKIIYLSIIFTIFCIPPKKYDPKLFNHLVIDAGSSGTRFCLYSVKKNHQCLIQHLNDPCYSVPANNGLSYLTEQEIYDVLNQGFEILRKKTQQIDFISLLGTGGFRKLSQQEQQQKFHILNRYFNQGSFNAYQIKFISGEEEAYYAWKSIAILYQSNEHITLETGGATIQFAVGNKEFFDYISLPIGLNQSYETLISYKEFEPCKQGNRLSQEKYDYCKNFVQTHLYQNKELNKFLELYKEYSNKYKTYTLGRPWNSIFNLVNKNPINIEDLKTSGIFYCNLSEQELIQKIPSNFAKRICYLFFYHQAQMEALKIQKIYRGTDSWTIGASIDEKTFPYCNSFN